VKVRSSLRFW